MSGWISLDRAITKHWLWQSEKFSKAQAWIDLLLWAAHTPNKQLIKGSLINVKRGEQIRSQITLARTWNWDRKTVSRFLKLLEKDGMIVSRVDHLTSYISICNYDSFQGGINDSPQLKVQLKVQQERSIEDTNNKDNNNNKLIKVEKIDYTEVINIFNRVMIRSPKVNKLNEKRKRLVVNLFKFASFDLTKFEGYLNHIHSNKSWDWCFEKRTGNDGVNYGKCSFDYFMKDSTYLKASEE